MVVGVPRLGVDVITITMHLTLTLPHFYVVGESDVDEALNVRMKIPR